MTGGSTVTISTLGSATSGAALETEEISFTLADKVVLLMLAGSMVVVGVWVEVSSG